MILNFSKTSPCIAAFYSPILYCIYWVIVFRFHAILFRFIEWSQEEEGAAVEYPEEADKASGARFAEGPDIEVADEERPLEIHSRAPPHSEWTVSSSTK